MNFNKENIYQYLKRILEEEEYVNKPKTTSIYLNKLEWEDLSKCIATGSKDVIKLAVAPPMYSMSLSDDDRICHSTYREVSIHRESD
jgi:hypothetical protein